MSRKRSGSPLSPHQEATKRSDLPNRLRQELRGYFEVARDLPHSILTLLIQLPNKTDAHRRSGVAERNSVN